MKLKNLDIFIDADKRIYLYLPEQHENLPSNARYLQLNTSGRAGRPGRVWQGYQGNCEILGNLSEGLDKFCKALKAQYES